MGDRQKTWLGDAAVLRLAVYILRHPYPVVSRSWAAGLLIGSLETAGWQPPAGLDKADDLEKLAAIEAVLADDAA